MAEYTIEKAWRDHFAPVVRGAGFRGIGRHFRRVTDDFVQVVNLQGSRYGGQFAVNLGLQPLSVPDLLGESADAQSVKASHCTFCRRLSDSGDKWWGYSSEKHSMDAAAKDAALLFMTVGMPLLDNIGGPRSPILVLTAAEFESSRPQLSGFSQSIPVTALACAHLRLLRGKRDEAAAFARIGLDEAGPQFGRLGELETILLAARADG